MLRRILIVALLLAAVLVPAASASRTPRVKLALLPLPKSALGPAARSLPLEQGSGVVSNKEAVGHGAFLTPTHSFEAPAPQAFRSLGRVTGYVLDYGLGTSGGSGVTEVWTSVDEYKTSTDAKKGLALWKSTDSETAALKQSGFAVAFKAEKVPHVGSGRFAFLVGFSAANIAPVFGVDEQFTEGRYEADVMVWAGTAAAAAKLAPGLAKKLDARIEHALAGKLHARPVKLPAKRKPGPPPGGPDLSPLALQTSDLSGPATALAPVYTVDDVNPTAVSDLQVEMIPAGPFDQLFQQIEWCSTANQASFSADFYDALISGGDGIPLDLSSLGDGAHGVYANDSNGGAGLVTFSNGRLFEWLEVLSNSSVQASDVQNVAQAAASHIDKAGLGSS